MTWDSTGNEFTGGFRMRCCLTLHSACHTFRPYYVQPFRDVA
jgi:hypothetical protein